MDCSSVYGDQYQEIAISVEKKQGLYQFYSSTWRSIFYPSSNDERTIIKDSPVNKPILLESTLIPGHYRNLNYWYYVENQNIYQIIYTPEDGPFNKNMEIINNNINELIISKENKIKYIKLFEEEWKEIGKSIPCEHLYNRRFIDLINGKILFSK
ncbi:hypothetical protein ACTA71_006790 [Dictyostelium dimigraforme]